MPTRTNSVSNPRRACAASGLAAAAVFACATLGCANAKQPIEPHSVVVIEQTLARDRARAAFLEQYGPEWFAAEVHAARSRPDAGADEHFLEHGELPTAPAAVQPPPSAADANAPGSTNAPRPAPRDRWTPLTSSTTMSLGMWDIASRLLPRAYPQHDVTLVVHRGRGLLFLADGAEVERIWLQPGAFAHVPRGRVFWLARTSETPLSVLAQFTPGGSPQAQPASGAGRRWSYEREPNAGDAE